MSFGQTTIGVTLISGFLVSAIGAALPDRPPALVVHDISIFADGSTNYDRTPVEGAWIAWSGQIFKQDGTLHCRGGDLFQYFGKDNPRDTKDVNWLVGPDCLDGLEVGMRYVFTWTPLGSDLSPVRYPASGFEAVLPTPAAQP